jgi:hypothetical protein
MPDPVVQVQINGIIATPGDGHKNAECYFSIDGGATPLPLANVLGSSKLFWNNAIAGYGIDAGDNVVCTVRGYMYRAETAGAPGPMNLVEYT